MRLSLSVHRICSKPPVRENRRCTARTRFARISYREYTDLGPKLILTSAVLALAATPVAQNFCYHYRRRWRFRFPVGDGGPATQAQLSQMSVTDPQGNVLVADRSNHQV